MPSQDDSGKPVEVEPKPDVPDNMVKASEHDEYGRFFKMLRMGVCRCVCARANAPMAFTRYTARRYPRAASNKRWASKHHTSIQVRLDY